MDQSRKTFILVLLKNVSVFLLVLLFCLSFFGCDRSSVSNVPNTASVMLQAFTPNWAPFTGGTPVSITIPTNHYQLTLSSTLSGRALRGGQETHSFQNSAQELFPVNGKITFPILSVRICNAEVSSLSLVGNVMQGITSQSISGDCQVVVTSAAGTTIRLDGFRYIGKPFIAETVPQLGSTLGGARVILKGYNFGEQNAVYFDGQAVTVLSNSESEIGVMIPPHGAGPVTVTVENLTHKHASLVGSGDYAYIAPVSLLGFSLNSATYVVGTPIAANIPILGVGTVDGFAISPRLPAGLTINPTTGAITGTPTAVAPKASYTISASNAASTAQTVIEIEVRDMPPAISYSPSAYTFTQNAPITSVMPVSSGGAVVSYSLNTALPAGLILNSVTGIITGTPTVVSPASSYVITAANSGGSATAVLNIAVNPIAPSGLTYSSNPAVYTKGMVIAPNTPTSSGGPVVSYSVNTSLPAGLTLNPTTGVIGGTPTVGSSAASFTITATNSGGSSMVVLNITVNDVAPSSLSYSSNPVVYTKGSAITPNTPTSSGGAVVSYAVSTALPAGLILNLATGVITGTPTLISPATNYTITATNAGGSATVVLNITVRDIAPSGLSYSSNPAAYTKGSAITPNTPTSSGGAAVSYSVNTALPAGLILNPATGVITGTPTVISPAANYTITATNAGGSATVVLNITVRDIAPSSLVYSSNPAAYTKDSAIAPNTPTSSGGAVISYSVNTGLPAGLTLNPSTGVITGTPTVASPATNYTITAMNSGGSTSVVLNLTVSPSLHAWAWEGGSKFVRTPGTYGTQGVPNAANYPGARREASTWVDNAGNFWLFGGTGMDGSGSGNGVLNDLWRFDGTNWTWMKGSSIQGQFGTYGTQGVAGAANTPGGRRGASSWKDASGNLWLFGGYGCTDTVCGVRMADVWKFNGVNWTWMKGLSVANESANYGTQGVASISNTPGARNVQCSARDTSGNLWLLGGSTVSGFLNDLWKFDGTNWTWVSGTNTPFDPGNYGTKGVRAASNIPGARARCNLLSDSGGNLWLRAGQATDSTPDGSDLYSDLWKYDGMWTWVSGEHTVNVFTNSGTLGVAAGTNTPGGRSGAAAWIDSLNNIYIFGGTGNDDTGARDEMADMWKFDGTNWVWISGTKKAFEPCVYGTLRVPDIANTPGSRRLSVTWVDLNGDLWLFGGFGNDSAGNQNEINDLWKYFLH